SGSILGQRQVETKETLDKVTTSNKIIFATGGTGGIYYPLGGAIAKVINDADLGFEIEVKSTGGSVENARLVSSNKATLAIMQNDQAYYAMHGMVAFENRALKNIRAIASLYPETIQIITNKNSGITSVVDLKGKKIAVGAKGSGTVENTKQILEVYGISMNDIKPIYSSFSEATVLLKHNQIDAAFLTAGAPTSAVTELSESIPIKIIPIEIAKANELTARYPYYEQDVIKAGAYSGVLDDVPTVAVMAILVTNKEADNTMIYKITKTIFDNENRIKKLHEKGAYIKKESALSGISIKLHLGAAAYYNKIGIL
ncbi:MAG TPA: TAXI family TRAP transporter solute-binding subunit, partial [Methanosarcinales archaeon]|nr:TAXI family TRAP transporter solute-binding subunit [Methanosarcinales archaeon]